MEKSKRIAIGGWLNNALNIMTRGWFGGSGIALDRTRKGCRDRLVTLFAGQGFNAVYGYAPPDLQGATKVLLIYAAASRHDVISHDLTNHFHRFFLDVYVRRESAGAAADGLDDMAEVVRSVIGQGEDDPTWNYLDLGDPSVVSVRQVAGLPYWNERRGLLIKVTE